MTTIAELLRHAERCDRLSEICTDLTIAQKLRQLAGEYRELAAHQRSPFKAGLVLNGVSKRASQFTRFD